MTDDSGRVKTEMDKLTQTENANGTIEAPEKESAADEEKKNAEKMNAGFENSEKLSGNKQKKIRILPVTTVLMLAAAVLAAFLLHAQFQSYENGILDICAKQQDGYVQLVLDQINLNAKRSDDEIIRDIIGTLNSSTSQYWTFSKGDQILFVKDVLETNKYRSLTIESYYEGKSASKFLDSLERDRVSHRQVSMRGHRYIASGAKFSYNGKEYRLILMTNNDVILDNNCYLSAKTGMVTLFAIVLVILAVVPMLLAWKCARAEQLGLLAQKEIDRQNRIIERSGNELMEIKRTQNFVKSDECIGKAKEKGMGCRYYELKFYLNASHYIIINGNKGEEHPHTWEFSIEFRLPREPFIEFSVVEKEIQGYLKKYQNRVLNEMQPFDEVLPTVENITDYFTGEFSNIISGFSGNLLKVKASETPTRTYVVLCEEPGHGE